MNTHLQFRRNCLSLLLLCCFFHPAISQQPNIIYIMTDDMGFADLSAYGRKDYQTPNIDKLCSQGVKFLNAYSAAPVCTPTRMAFVTGRYPAKHVGGTFEPLVGGTRDTAYGITPETPSIGLELKKAGYETALIGKWHLGFQKVHHPNNNGFDYFFGIIAGAADYFSHKNDARRKDFYEQTRMIDTTGYVTNMLADKAVQFLKQPHSKPFFLSLQFTAPHWPWQGPNDMAYPDTTNFRAGGSPKVYAEMMKSLDDAIGSIMKTIDDQKLANNTVIIFTNDNGGEKYSDNGPFSKGKMDLWEGGLRVPAFVRWPGKIKPNTTTNQVAITMDWTTTILRLAAANHSTASDGIDLMPIMTGKSDTLQRTLYWRLAQRKQQKAIIDGQWKYLQDENGEYLFDIIQDPSEKNNLKDAHTAVFSRLKSMHESWNKNLVEPLPLVK